MADKYNKWVATWGNATSITDRKEATYARNLTLRYPVRMAFDGCALRFRFSNLTGTEPVSLTEVCVARPGATYAPVAITFGGCTSVSIAPGCEVESDAIAFTVEAGETLDVSLYLADFTQLNAGTLITGPLSHGKYCYGRYTTAAELPLDLTRNTNWFYFLNTIDVLTESTNRAVVCFGDSITAQSWPDYLTLMAWEAGLRHVAFIRRAVSGTRILRQYDCITYQAYGLKGATRFPIELNVAGATDVIIQHGINDIIHPVGTDVNPFRPWSDMPTLADLQQGTEQIYVQHARQLGLNVWSGTLLPIHGWRTYTPERDHLRHAFNEWLRTSPIFDGCIDFDSALRHPDHPESFAPGFDSGDHLHPSEEAYRQMAKTCLDHFLGILGATPLPTEAPQLNAHNKAEHAPSHTAEHLLNQTMVRLFGCERSKNAHIERKKSKINFLLPQPPTEAQVADIEARINALIAADLPVTYEFVTRDTIPAGVKLDKLPTDASETLRLVRIGTSTSSAQAYDVCPCIGQHVASTAEIGHFRITSTSWTPATDGTLGSFRIVFKVG